VAPIQVIVESKEALEGLSELRKRIATLGEAWLPLFYQHMREVTDSTFTSLSHGGSTRGVWWAPFKHKPPKRRGGWSARLLEDTGRLRRDATAYIRELSPWAIAFGTQTPYASYQQKMRPFLFFELPKDAQRAAQIAREVIKG